MSRNKDEDDLEEYQKKVEAITRLYRRRPHNMIEEVEKLGFEYCVDDGDDADEIAEEKTARPENEKRLVSFLENRAEPDDKITALWCQETQNQILLMQLAFLHEFVPMHQEILVRYAHACDEEADLKKFASLAQDFDEAAGSFDYDPLKALRERYAGNPSKSAIITSLLDERAKRENEVVSF